MLWVVFTILMTLWLLGLATAFTLGGFIHLLLVIILVLIVIRLLG